MELLYKHGSPTQSLTSTPRSSQAGRRATIATAASTSLPSPIRKTKRQRVTRHNPIVECLHNLLCRDVDEVDAPPPDCRELHRKHGWLDYFEATPPEQNKSGLYSSRDSADEDQRRPSTVRLEPLVYEHHNGRKMLLEKRKKHERASLTSGSNKERVKVNNAFEDVVLSYLEHGVEDLGMYAIVTVSSRSCSSSSSSCGP